MSPPPTDFATWVRTPEGADYLQARAAASHALEVCERRDREWDSTWRSYPWPQVPAVPAPPPYRGFAEAPIDRWDPSLSPVGKLSVVTAALGALFVLMGVLGSASSLALGAVLLAGGLAAGLLSRQQHERRRADQDARRRAVQDGWARHVDEVSGARALFAGEIEMKKDLVEGLGFDPTTQSAAQWVPWSASRREQREWLALMVNGPQQPVDATTVARIHQTAGEVTRVREDGDFPRGTVQSARDLATAWRLQGS